MLIKLIGLGISWVVWLGLLLPRGIRGRIEVSHKEGMDDQGEIWRRRRRVKLEGGEKRR